MSKQITKTLYTFKELLALEKEGKATSKAVERVRHSLQQSITSDEWYDSDEQDWMTALAEVGFTDAKINFTGFGSQGDGASFESNIDLRKLITFLSVPVQPSDQILDGEENGWLGYVVHKLGAAYKPDPKFAELHKLVADENVYLNAKVERTDRRYVHEYTCKLTIEPDDGNTYPLLDEFEKVAEQLRQQLCSIIYHVLQDQYFALQEDECLIDEDESQNGEACWDIKGKKIIEDQEDDE